MKNELSFDKLRISMRRWGWLFLIVLVYLCQGLWHFGKPVAPDAITTYLPFAKKFMDQGLYFLVQPESIMVPPVAYMWPAIFGGDATAVKYANLVAGIFMVLLTYGIGRQLHSRVAGLVAALMFATSPFIVRWIPTALSEPPFFLFTLAWLWGLGEVFVGKKWAIIFAAFSLSLSILSRGVWIYPSVALLAFALIWMFINPKSKRTAVYLASSLALGMIVPILVIIKNLLLFGLPGIATGSGAALFLGAHVMTNGFEPPLLGLAYEAGANGFHSVIGDRESAIVAIQFIKERSLIELWDWYLAKISWVTLFTTLEAPVFVSVIRAIELAMALAATLWGIKYRKTFVILLGFGVFLQILQTGFVIYNIRYSIDNIELLLVPLAAVGIVLSLGVGNDSTDFKRNHGESERFFRTYQYGIIGVSITAVLLVMVYFRSVPTIHLPRNIPVSVLFESAGAAMNGKTHTSATEHYIEIDVPEMKLPSHVGSAIWKINMAVNPDGHNHCNKASVTFSPDNPIAAPSSIFENKIHVESRLSGKRDTVGMAVGQILTTIKSWFVSTQNKSIEKGAVYFNVNDDGLVHSYFIGTVISGAALFPDKPGKLVVKLDCSSDAKIAIDEISLVAPHFIETYFRE